MLNYDQGLLLFDKMLYYKQLKRVLCERENVFMYILKPLVIYTVLSCTSLVVEEQHKAVFLRPFAQNKTTERGNGYNVWSKVDAVLML